MHPTPGPAVPSTPRATRSPLRWLIPLAAVLLLGGGLAIYVSRGAGMRDRALTAYAADDCTTVTALTEDLGQQYTLPGLAYVAETSEARLACARLDGAGAQARAGEYEAAVATYDAFLADLGASPIAPRAAAERTEAVFAWAARQREQGQYAGALKTYRLLSRDDAALAARADEATAQAYAEWGAADLAAANPGDAIQHWRTLLTEYPATSAAMAAPGQIVGAYAGWAKELLAAGSYEELLELYADELSWAEGQGDQALVAATRLGQAGALLAWSEVLAAGGDYEAAWKQNAAAVEADPEPQAGGGPGAKATAAQPDLLRAWAAQLIAQDNPTLALAKLEDARKLIDPGSAALLAAVDDEIAGALLAGAAKSVKGKRFIKALELIEQAAAHATAEGTKAAVAEQRAVTTDAFARSDGPEGDVAVKGAIGAICGAGELPTLPPFALADARVRLGLFTGENWYGYELPTELTARTPAELHYVACASKESRVVEHCDYNNGYAVERTRSYLTLNVRAVPSGRVIEKRTFSGPVPEACDFIETFSFGQWVKIKAGGLPDEAAVTAWLRGFTE